MKLIFDIDPDKTAPDAAGEAIMRQLNGDDRWGYSTHEFHVRSEELPLDENDLLARTLCCGRFAKLEKPTKWYLPGLGLNLFLYWDGDGTIVFQHMTEGWYLYNDDCKKSYGWEWVGKDSWVYDLPPDYYEANS